MSDDDLKLRAQGRVGTVLGGKYRIDGVLGVGGMAVVFAATHRNQRRVAIKMLHPGISIHREVRERFLREGYAANTVDHPGAVAVLDDDTAEDGAAYLVMERLEGDEVDRICQRRGGRLEVDVVLAIADALLGVLQAAHAKAIIHRDIKPTNLYVTRDGSLKVLDFGIARLRDAASGGSAATKTGMMLGTPTFMSPEQALSKSSEIDGRSDLWSVGATLFALLSGTMVHEGETASAVIVQAATQPARPLVAALPGVDPRVAAIVDRALAFDKAARWPDAAAMRAAVRAAYLEMFGRRVGREPLEQLFEEAAGTANTVYAMEAVATANTAYAPSTPSPRVLTPVPAITPIGTASHAGPGPAAPSPGPATPPPFIPPLIASASPAPAPWPSQATPPPVTMGAQPPAPSGHAGHAGGYPQPPGPAVHPSYPPTPYPQVPYGQPPGPPHGSVPAAGLAFPGAAAPAKPRFPVAIVAGATIFVCGGLALVAGWRSSARSAAPPAPSAEPSIAAGAGADPPSAAASTATASASAAEEPSAPAPAAPPGESAIAPASPASPKPAPLPSIVTRPVVPPAPAPPPTPVYTPPPAVCRAQCTDIARACKASCKAQYRIGHDRHQCLVSCETTERECKARSPC